MTASFFTPDIRLSQDHTYFAGKKCKMSRPELNKQLAPGDFKNYYWLKKELVNFCTKEGINTSGGKIDIAKRIEEYLETGKVQKTQSVNKKYISAFDWKKVTLSTKTVITDNYKNTQNVRAFFQKETGKSFRFNTEFMNWMKQNPGKTLGDAVVKWKEIKRNSKTKAFKTVIAPQFEYNTYIRDFMKDNPNSSMKDAIKSWKSIRNLPGEKKYNKEN